MGIFSSPINDTLKPSGMREGSADEVPQAPARQASPALPCENGKKTHFPDNGKGYSWGRWYGDRKGTSQEKCRSHAKAAHDLDKYPGNMDQLLFEKRGYAKKVKKNNSIAAIRRRANMGPFNRLSAFIPELFKENTFVKKIIILQDFTRKIVC